MISGSATTSLPTPMKLTGPTTDALPTAASVHHYSSFVLLHNVHHRWPTDGRAQPDAWRAQIDHYLINGRNPVLIDWEAACPAAHPDVVRATGST